MASKHPCTMCFKLFSYASNLARHLLARTGEKLHKCEQCKMSLSQAGTLIRHLLTHRGEMLQRCAQCNKSFSLAHQLKRHLLIHAGVKLHKCAQCDKLHLRRHLLTHTGEISLVCPTLSIFPLPHRNSTLPATLPYKSCKLELRGTKYTQLEV